MRVSASFFLLLFCAALNSRAALGALGDRVEGIEKDRVALRGVREVPKAFENYTVHEITSDGLTVREYVSKGGLVFGIFWEGGQQPDLTPLLGKYLRNYEHALKGERRILGRRAHQRVQDGGVVVEKFGHMRAMRGRAYLPAELPAGVTPNEIH